VTRRSDLIDEILRTVPRQRLMAAIAFIEGHRQSVRTGVPMPDEASGAAGWKVPVDVEAFMATSSVRQLRLLRKIALGLDEEVVTEH
jgi:hypothetical protein